MTRTGPNQRTDGVGAECASVVPEVNGSLWFRAVDGRQIEVRAEVHSMGNTVIIAGYRLDPWVARQFASAVDGLGQAVAP